MIEEPGSTPEFEGSAALRQNGGRRRPVVYLLPCRVQQGWGDVVEMARASRALAGAGFPLLYLTEGTPTPQLPQRGDPRAVPVDPGSVRWAGFPRVTRIGRPLGGQPAIVLATWWGMTARRTDSEGGPVPGVFAERVERIVTSHRGWGVLHVSLEEFGSGASSRTASREALRQAGYDPPRIARYLASAEGKAWRLRYHQAFVAARGGDREDVLHLAGAFSRSPGASREFPFMIEVGPYGFPRSPPCRAPTLRGSRKRVLWYASPEDSYSFAQELLAPRGSTAVSRVRFEIRLGSRDRGELERWVMGSGEAPRNSPERGPGAPRPEVMVLPVQGAGEWRRRMASADVVIAGGSQSLVEALARARPFLYFNGRMRGLTGDRSRAFRREKLLSLTRAMRTRGVPRDLVRDLLAFADGFEPARVLERALHAAEWREGLSPLFDPAAWPPWDLPPLRRDGGTYLVDVAQRFARGEAPVPDLVRSLRAEARG